MGAKVEGIDTHTLTITGVGSLNGADWSVIPDRIEAGTYATAAAMTGGDVTLTKMRPALLTALTLKLRESVASIIWIAASSGSRRSWGPAAPRCGV